MVRGLASTGDVYRAQEVSKTIDRVDPSYHLFIAEADEAMEDIERAKHFAISAYKYAWADGPPYAHRFNLKEATALLERLGIDPPDLPYVTPDDLPRDPLYDEALAYVEKLEAEHRKENDDDGD